MRKQFWRLEDLSTNSGRESRRPQRVDVSSVRFLGEQDGPPERVLKTRLAEFCSQTFEIERAYLARAEFGPSGNLAVVLCFRSSRGYDNSIVEAVARIFASLFSCEEQLDILFLTDKQEDELDAVCKPFFGWASS